MENSKDHKAAAEPPLNCRVGQRFNPCETADCRARCDNFGVYCEEICIDEIDRLRGALITGASLLEQGCNAEDMAALMRRAAAVPNA